jgi:hypothetical protein
MKINPANPSASYSTYSTSPNNPDWVTYADGDLWVPINNTIIEVNPTSLQTIRTITLASSAKSITYFDGYIWAASSSASSGGNLYRINPSDGSISATIGGAPANPVYIAACSLGSSSTLWITGSRTNGSPYSISEVGNLTASSPTLLQQIDTGTSFQSAYGNTENNNTYGAACGYGYVWIGSDYVTQLTSGNIGFGDGNLRVYNEYTGKLVATDQLNGKQIAVTLSNGMVWIDDVNSDSILGYTPSSLIN